MNATDTHGGDFRVVTRYLVCVVLAGALLALPAVGRAAVVRTVCASGCDFMSVNAAVTASSAGDGIEVMPGIYDQKVDVRAADPCVSVRRRQRPDVRVPDLLERRQARQQRVDRRCELGGATPLWEWIDEGATVFSY